MLHAKFWQLHSRITSLTFEMHNQGHLLVLEGLPRLKLNHGLMEFEYTANYTKVRSSQLEDVRVPSVVTDPGIPDESFQVAMTASMDNSGRLLLGTISEESPC